MSNRVFTVIQGRKQHFADSNEKGFAAEHAIDADQGGRMVALLIVDGKNVNE
jgi:hypothetical protein